ncbi:hypothetical protein L596_005546 [Steinernema carpocapsae]|uniref:Uncharacterized protein n=1 Tax=Steinernema carpocapsae TaxID=34508 RepID=A0A4U8V0J4_STECR|nr:hypothetical protein L596_005546 [Steinernema carpocapsae]
MASDIPLVHLSALRGPFLETAVKLLEELHRLQSAVGAARELNENRSDIGLTSSRLHLSTKTRRRPMVSQGRSITKDPKERCAAPGGSIRPRVALSAGSRQLLHLFRQ